MISARAISLYSRRPIKEVVGKIKESGRKEYFKTLVMPYDFALKIMLAVCLDVTFDCARQYHDRYKKMKKGKVKNLGVLP